MSQPLRWLARSRPYICQRCVVKARNNARAFSVSTRASSQAQAIQNEKISVLSILESRGYIKEIAGDRNALDKLLQTRPVGFYSGIDPTAPSLHLGHLLPLMVLFWLYFHGHHSVSLVGGATARVGDPSGRLTSRAKTESSVHERNFNSLHDHVGRVWNSAQAYGKRHGYMQDGQGRKSLLNNADWLTKLNVVDFLQLLGSGMRIGTMLGRDTVKNKMEKGDGMSFAEFTYPLLQAWDWWHMYQHDGIQVQVGGSDQYGNIIAGMDAIKYATQGISDLPGSEFVLDRNGKLKDEFSPMGITVPLLTTASGEKFGKSAGNAVWLNKDMTSPFDLYGFLLRSSDDDIERYLKLFTFVPLDDIQSVMARHSEDPGKRVAQHLLAYEVLDLVHGPDIATKTRSEHQASRSPTLAALTQRFGPKMENENDVAAGETDKRIVLPRSLVSDTPWARILYHAGLVPTKSEGARLVKSGGVYVASSTGSDMGVDQNLTFVSTRDHKPEQIESFLNNGLLVLRMGKWKVRVLEVVEDGQFDEQGEGAPGWQEWKETR